MFTDEDKKRNERIRSMRPLSFPEETVSSTVDLRHWMSPIEHQLDMNTCCANAFAGVCEYLIKRYTKRPMDVSRLFIYYNGQILNQQTHHVKDEGFSQRDVALALRKYGLCQEYIWPYKKQLLNVQPSKEAYRKASRYTVVPLRIPFDIKAIERCLHNQIPILIDIKLMDNTGTQIRANNGYLTIPNLNNSLLDRTTLHTVLIVGYYHHRKYFIVRNSWGGNWGYRGYFYMPYDYLDDKRLVNTYDGLWTIIDIIQREEKLPTLRQLVLSKQEHQHHQSNIH